MADLAGSFDDAWVRFVESATVRLASEGPDPAWTAGRAQYLTFLVRPDGRAARDYIERTIERLSVVPGIEPFPDWYWHITIKGAGFQVIKRSHDDDVLRQDVARIAGNARAVLREQPAYHARLGPINAFADVVFLEVHDAGRTRELNAALADGLPQLARYPSDGERFLPHVSIARFTSNEHVDEIKAALAALRSEAPAPAPSASLSPQRVTLGDRASFPVRRVEFVKAWLSEDPPEFDVLATYALAAERA